MFWGNITDIDIFVALPHGHNVNIVLNCINNILNNIFNIFV